MLLRLVFLTFPSILAASPAGASWFETGFVGIVANLSPAEAEDIDPGDVIDSVQIGSAGESGEVTVVGKGDVTTRQSLGSWRVSNGQGNIQSSTMTRRNGDSCRSWDLCRFQAANGASSTRSCLTSSSRRRCAIVERSPSSPSVFRFLSRATRASEEGVTVGAWSVQAGFLGPTTGSM